MHGRDTGKSAREAHWSRRAFLKHGAVVGAGAALAPWSALADTHAGKLPTQLLEDSEFVYISPLKSDGNESSCHGEVWYGWLDDSVVINTAPGTWKGRALAKGLDRAKVWVGNHGRWKGLLGKNEAFRKAPFFEAKVTSVEGDPALLNRLLALYETKYPAEIADWRDRMRRGYETGERLLLRYAPV
ncbi:MAG: twin-arginine translocation signal domain-containing protein [Myxococcota bacterium]